MRTSIFALSGILALTVIGCGNDSTTKCGQGTQDDGEGNCVAIPCADAGSTDGATGGLTCGDHQTAMANVCQINDSACLTGTKFDSTTHTCRLPDDKGTLVDQQNFLVNYIHLYYKDTASSPNTYKPAGTPTTTTQADSTPLYLSDGTPMGGTPNLKLRYAGNGGTLIDNTPTAFDTTKHLTIGDYKKCNASVAFYKPANYDSVTNAKYLMVVDAAGCPANFLYTVWFFYTPSPIADKDAAFNARSFATPAGGMPNTMVTDDNGKGHWERLIDAKTYFKKGTNVAWGAAHSNTIVPPEAGSMLLPTIVTHPYGHSNGNPLLCQLSAVNLGKCYNVTTVGDMPLIGRQNYAQATGNPGLDSQFSNAAYVDLDKLQP